MNEIDFARKTREFIKIRELNSKDVADGLAMIFVKASNLAGIKEPISQNNKTDIAEMISIKFKGLSLEEIEYAFRHDRYSGDAIQHFQLFNTVYVSAILKKYNDFISKLRFEKKINSSLNEIQKPEISEKERLKIVEKHITEMTMKFLATGEIEGVYMYLYYELFKQKKLPVHNKKYINWIKKRVQKSIYKSKGSTVSSLEQLKRNALIKFNLGKGKNEIEVNQILKENKLFRFPKEDYKIKKTLKLIQSGKEDLSFHCRNLILKDYINSKIRR